MAFFSIGGRARNGITRTAKSASPDPYVPGSPAYQSRNRQTETILPNGMIRVDMGEPIKRLPSEALPSTSRLPAEPPLAPKVEPEPEIPTPRRRPIHSRAHLEPYGINRGEVSTRHEND
jgi:hypothetical protein